MASRIVKRTGKSGKISWLSRTPTGELTEKGNPRMHCRTFKYKREAQAYGDELDDARKAGGPVKESEQTLQDFYHAVYLPSLDVRESTLISYKSKFKSYVKDELGSIPIKDITPRRVQALYNALKARLGPRSIELVHIPLSGCFKHAVSLLVLRSNPTEGVKRPRRVQPPLRFLQGEEIKAFREALKGNRYRALFEFILSTGTRPGEARAVKWTDLGVNKEKKPTVHIQRGINDAKPYAFNPPKTSKGDRVIELHPETMSMLAAHKAEQGVQRLKAGGRWEPLGLIFSNALGGPLDRRNLNKAHVKKLVKRVAEDLGLKGEDYERVCSCSLYSLRHSHATGLVEGGTDIKTVSERLGHSDIQTTLTLYVHVTPALEEKAIEVIGEFMYA